MTLEDALFVTLAADPEVNPIVAEPSLVRIFKGVAPQGTRAPYVTMQRQETTGIQGQCGTLGTEFALVMVDTYARSTDERDQLAREVFLTLRDFSGTIDTLKIKNCVRRNEFDVDDPEPGLYRRSQLWAIWFIE